MPIPGPGVSMYHLHDTLLFSFLVYIGFAFRLWLCNCQRILIAGFSVTIVGNICTPNNHLKNTFVKVKSLRVVID